jgi:8-oxo-dGTP pyrophosphatase MutT (NUDIX family)
VNHEEFKNRLADFQSRPLPALKAQMELSPLGRDSIEDLTVNDVKFRKAAVLALVENVNNEARLILTSRAAYPGTHGGQVSFPGGQREKEDDNYEETAARETEEEIGVARKHYKIIRSLSSLYIPPSNFMVYPFLAYSENPLQMTRDEREVAAIHSIPIAHFLADNAIKSTSIKMKNGQYLKTPAFLIDGLVIWGATAMMIAEIRSLLRDEL